MVVDFFGGTYMIKLVVDMQGGDNSYEMSVPAVIRFLNDFPEVTIYGCGKKEPLLGLISEFPERFIFVEAPEEIPMEAGVLEVLRLKNSPIIKGLDIILNKEAMAMVSAGGTGGFLSAATLKLKTIPGIKRAALVSPFPTFVKGKQVVVLDIGANNENSALELYQFALMGRIYSQKVVGVNEPKTYLLSNGSEEGKGSPVVSETAKLLKESNFPGFCGNTEGSTALNGDCDVLVCDGFSGNVFLKSSEGMAKFFGNTIKKTFKKNIFSKLSYLGVRKSIKSLNETLSYKHLGGAMLLGINGVCVKAHGSSNSDSFYYSIRVAYYLVKENVLTLIKEGIESGLSSN